MSVEKFINGAAEIARLAASGFTSDSITEGRLKVCGDCPEYSAQFIGGEWNQETGQYGKWTEKKICNLCGCTMPWKAKFNAADCPLGKW